MKSYIFRPREVEILKHFLEKEKKLDGFRDIKYHILKNRACLTEHARLMEQVLEKLGIEG